MHGHGYVYQHKLYYYMVHLRNLFAITLLMIYLSATIDSEDDCDNYYNDTDEDDEDEPLSDSFSDYETDNNPNWRVERLQREEYLAVYIWLFTLKLLYTCYLYLPYGVSGMCILKLQSYQWHKLLYNFISHVIAERTST